MPISRTALIDQLATRILTLHPERPTLVAIDGRSAAGKTTLADALALHIQVLERPVLRSSIDDFHPPGHKYRSRERPYTSESYYREGYDYATFRAFVLEPLQPNGSRRCRLAFWESFRDCAFPEEWVDLPNDAILIVDGIFLLQPSLRAYWDFTIWLQIDWQTMIERATNRDVAWVGSAEVVAERYQTFWVPTHQYYEELIQPIEHVDVIVDNHTPEAPVLITRPKSTSC